MRSIKFLLYVSHNTFKFYVRFHKFVKFRFKSAKIIPSIHKPIPIDWNRDLRELMSFCLQKLLTKDVGQQKNKIVPCCSPTQLAPLQLLYIDTNNSITQKTLPNMVVEACGCM